MPRNGSGVASLPSNSFNPAVSGQEAEPGDWNDTAQDIEDMLTQSIASNGVTTPSTNLPMGGFKHTGVGVSSALTQYLRTDQGQNGSTQYAVASGTNTYTATLAPVPAAYVNGQTFRIRFTNGNTGASTLNLNSIGARALQKPGGTALVSGDIPAASVWQVVFDASAFTIGNSVLTGLAPSDAQYFTLALSSGLSAERRLAFSSSFTTVDGGAGSAYTVDIAALGIVAGDIAANAVTTTKILDSNVTLAKIVSASAASVLLGRGSAAGGGVFQEITLGAGLSMSSQVLNTAATAGFSMFDSDTPSAAASSTLTGINASSRGLILLGKIFPATDQAEINLVFRDAGGDITTRTMMNVPMPPSAAVTTSANQNVVIEIGLNVSNNATTGGVAFLIYVPMIKGTVERHGFLISHHGVNTNARMVFFNVTDTDPITEVKIVASTGNISGNFDGFEWV